MVRETLDAAGQAEADQWIEAFKHILEATMSDLRSHLDDDRASRTVLKKLAEMARGDDMVSVHHQDAKSQTDIPRMLQEAVGTKLSKYKVPVQGWYGLHDYTFATLLRDHHASADKDAGAICNDILLFEILTQPSSVRMTVIALDCAPVNHCCTVALQLPQLLVDMGFVDVAVMVFFAQNHGKCMCDCMFGALSRLLVWVTIMGLDCLSRHIERLISNHLKGTKSLCYIFHPQSSSDIKAKLNDMYHGSDSVPFKGGKYQDQSGRSQRTKGIMFKTFNPHMTVASNPERVQAWGAEHSVVKR